MALNLNTNIVSVNAQRNLGQSGSALATAMQRLSSGLRVNSAKDDAAGLAIAERMQTQVRGLGMAARNANDGISLAQTTEGALGKVADMLQRMRQLAVQSANATNSDSDRAALQAEVSQLRAEVDRVATTTSFNGRHVLNGSFAGGVFQVGAMAGEQITVGALVNAQSRTLGDTQVGERVLHINMPAMTDLSALPAGVLQVQAQGQVWDLGPIAAAHSPLERAGQLVAAINAKTPDTGMTAYLEPNGQGGWSMALLQTPGLAGANPQALLQGFTLAQTGLQAASAIAPPSHGAPADYTSYIMGLDEIQQLVVDAHPHYPNAITVTPLPSNLATATYSDAVAFRDAVKVAYDDYYYGLRTWGSFEVSRDADYNVTLEVVGNANAWDDGEPFSAAMQELQEHLLAPRICQGHGMSAGVFLAMAAGLG